MISVTFFETEEELQELTGLSHEKLWDNGFNLDDWDWGFVSDCEWDKSYIDEYGYLQAEPDYDKACYQYQIMNTMNSYCVGYRKTVFCGKYYYLQYHS